MYSSHELMTPRGSRRYGFGAESGEFHLTKECCLDCMEPLQSFEAIFQYACAFDEVIAIGSQRWCPICTGARNLFPDTGDKDMAVGIVNIPCGEERTSATTASFPARSVMQNRSTQSQLIRFLVFVSVVFEKLRYSVEIPTVRS